MSSIVEEILDEYADAHRHTPLEDLYREQDRILSVIARLNTARPVPVKTVDLLERKLLIMETMIDAKFPRPDLTKPDTMPIV